MPWFIGVALMLVFILLFRIVFSSSSIGAPATESEALVRSSERLIQTVQWTISTVLVVAGGLIGLNLYRDEKRYERDRQELRQIKEDLDDYREANDERIVTLSQESISMRFSMAIDAMNASNTEIDIFWEILDGYQRLRTLEAPSTYRTSILLQEGLELMDLEGGEIEFADESEAIEFYSFVDSIVREFLQFETIVARLKDRVSVSQ